jgi:hypothetical protein
MGKIIYSELQELLKNGKSQADCARHFHVSEPAICKAVKRLKAMTPPASMERLNEKKRLFVLNIAEGKNATDSAMAVYDCKNRDVAKSTGCRMLKDPDIQLALTDLMAQEGIPRRRRIQRLRDLIESNDLSSVAKGIDMAAKMAGDYAPEKIEIDVDVRELSMSFSEALQAVRNQGRIIDVTGKA